MALAMALRLPSSAIGRWAVRLALWLALLCATWWLGGADGYLRLLMGLADATLPRWVFADVERIVWQGHPAMQVFTTLAIANTDEFLLMSMAKQTVMHFVLGFPIAGALLLATPGRKKRRLMLGSLALISVSLLEVAAFIWANLAVIVNHRASLMEATLVPPSFTVVAMAYPEWQFHLSGFAYYLAMVAAPLMAPVLIWVLLCPGGVARLLVSLRRSGIRRR